jgi:hypothetical protein
MTTEKLIKSRLKSDQYIFATQLPDKADGKMTVPQRELFNARICSVDKEVQNLKQKLQQYS